MYRFRFHGRGGQGIKTASRIFGTAAFLEGFYAQDFPMYGPERRGAPVAAYVRVSREPIVNRGYITHPDVVLVGDETLLFDPVADPLRGFSGGVLFVNTMTSPQIDISGELVTLDVTGLALEYIGRTSAISAGVGAIACKIAGFSKGTTMEAVERELEELGLSEELIDKNLRLAEESYRNVPSFDLDSLPSVRESDYIDTNVVHVKLDEGYVGVATIAKLGNTAVRRTGSWRILKPVVDLNKCTGCKICFAYCPDVSIYLGEDDKAYIDYDHCKGCLICSSVCPFKAITMVREVKTL